jgi:hypothetical protein
MASLAGPPPTPWPRMHSGQENPFQNAPGPFIYALPNLAGTCPFKFSDTVLSCSFAADSTTAHHCHHCYHHPAVSSRCHQQHPPPESAEPSPTEERADPELSSPQSPLDESHFDLDDIISPSSLTDIRAELCSRQQQQQEQREEERSEPSTPTQSQSFSSLSPIGSEFPEATKDLEDENEKDEGEGTRGPRCRKRRRRAKGRQLLEHGGCVMGPRVMGLSGLHFDRWTRYVCPSPIPLPPPPSAAMSNHAWVLAAGYNGFVPPNSPALFWDRVPGFVGVPSW